MTRYFFSPSVLGFYSSATHSELPADAIELTSNEYKSLAINRPREMAIEAGQDGKPRLRKPKEPAPTIESIEAMRLRAYSDPITGSDRYFAEASRMQAMGEIGWEAVHAAGVERYQAIQAEYPWPPG